MFSRLERFHALISLLKTSEELKNLRERDEERKRERVEQMKREGEQKRRERASSIAIQQKFLSQSWFHGCAKTIQR
jgi:hypothetical protein